MGHASDSSGDFFAEDAEPTRQARAPRLLSSANGQDIRQEAGPILRFAMNEFQQDLAGTTGRTLVQAQETPCQNGSAVASFVSYLRVSTERQGRSGLGLEAQRRAVADFLAGGSWRHVAELVEVESGSRDNRPRLSEAMALCRLTGPRWSSPS